MGRHDEITDVPLNQALHEYVIANAPLFTDKDFGENVRSLLHYTQEAFVLFIFSAGNQASLFGLPDDFLYQLRSDKTGIRGAVYGTREEAYGGAGSEPAPAG